MAIKEFQIGPLEYVEGNYFDGDYTQPNVAKFFLDCDVDGFKGGRVITGEFFTDNYIDGTYTHSNSIKSTLTVDYDVIVEFSAGLQDYTVESYFDDLYVQPQGSQFVLYARPTDDIQFEIAITATSSVSTQAGKQVVADITLAASFTQTAFGQRAQDTDLFAFSDAAIQAQVDRIRDNNIEATAFYTVAADVTRIKQLDTDAFDQFSFVGDVQRSRDAELQAQAAFSFAVSEDLFKDFASDLTDNFTQSVQEDLFKAFAAALSDTFTQTTQEDLFKAFDATISVEASVEAEFRVVRDAHLTGTGVASIVCDAGKIVDESTAMSDDVTLTSLSGKLQTAESQQPFRFVVLAVTDRRDNILYFDRNANVSFTAQGAVLAQNGEIISTANSSSEEWTSLPFQSQISNIGEARFSSANYSIVLTVTLASSTHNPGIIVKAGQNNSSGIHWWNISIEHINATTKRVRLQDSNYDTGIRYWDVSNNDWTQPTKISLAGVYNANYISGKRHAFLSINDVQIGPSIRHDIHGLGWTTQPDPRISLVNTTNQPIIVERFTYSKPSLPGTAYSDGLVRRIRLFFDETQLLNQDVLDPFFYVNHIGEAAVTSQATLAASSTVDYDLTLNLSSQSSVNADVNKIGDINLVAFSDGALSAQALKIHPGDAVIESLLSLTAEAVANRQYDSDVGSEFTQQSDVERLRDNDSQLVSEFTQIAAAEKITDTGSTIESTTSVTAQIGRLEEINLLAFSDGAIECTISKTTGYTSDVSSEATVDAVIGNKKPLAADLLSEAAVTSDTDRLRDNEIVAVTEANISTSIDRLRQGVISITAQSKTVNTYIEEEHGLYIDDGYFTEFEIIAQKITDITQDFAAEFQITALIGGSFLAELVANTAADITASAVKQVSALVDKAAEFAVTALASPIKDFNSNISSEFAVFANGVTGGEINAVLFNAAALTAIPEATRPFDSSLSSEFTQNTDTSDSLNISGASDQTAEFSQSSDVNVIRDAVIVTESIATSLTAAVKETVTDVLCETRFDIIIDGAKVTDITSNNDATLTISNTAVKTASGVADITSEATVGADATVVISAVISTESIASQLTAVAKVAAFFVNADVISTVSVDAVVVRSAVSENQITFTTNIDVVVVRSAGADIDTDSNVSALVGVVKPFAATIQSAMAFAAGVREIRTDAVVYVIPGEGFTHTITGEGRVHLIIGESRVRKITAESRLRRINGESRIYNIE